MAKKNRINRAFKRRYISKAIKILKKNKNLNSFSRKDFQRLIEELLALDGWKVYHERIIKGGRAEIIATKEDVRIGFFKVIWKVKKYKPPKFIDARDIKELGFSIVKLRASKGVIVSIGGYTSGALQLLKESESSMSKMDAQNVENWIYGFGKVNDDGRNLPF